MPRQLAHATSNGASLRTGDLEDGDEAVLPGRSGAVELGAVHGRVLPARG